MLLDIIIHGIKTKILTWTPKTQYASLIFLIGINEIFSLYIFESKESLRYSCKIIYAGICIILYVIHLYKILRKDYDWFLYAVISFKFYLSMAIIILMIFIVLGIMNTKVSISKTIIIE